MVNVGKYTNFTWIRHGILKKYLEPFDDPAVLHGVFGSSFEGFKPRRKDPNLVVSPPRGPRS